MDLKENALETSHYLELLSQYSEIERAVCNHDVEGFSSLCRELQIPDRNIESLKSLVFPPLSSVPWPPMSPSPASPTAS